MSVLKRLHQSRADNSFGKELVRLIRHPVLIIDDFGLQRLNAQESKDRYEVTIERYAGGLRRL
jgi:DNA replication protein DnaC